MEPILRPSYWVRLFDATSQWLNVALLDGDANESISGRSYRLSWPAMAIIDALIFWDTEHCKMAYYTDLARAKTLIYDAEQEGFDNK